MKSLLKTGITCAFLCTFCLSLSGCSGDGGDPAQASIPPADRVLVIGDAAHQVIDYNAPMVEEAVRECIASQGTLSVILADGEPSKVYSKTFEEENMKENRINHLVKKESNKIKRTLPSADDAQVDYYAGLDLAARELSSSASSDKAILCMGSGLNTSGILDFHDANLLLANPAEIAGNLSGEKLLPDFTDIKVKTVFLGCTTDGQEPLDSKQKDALSSIYEEIVILGGGTYSYDKSSPAEASGEKDKEKEYPPVDILHFSETAYDLYTVGLLNKPDAFEKPVVLEENQIHFFPDSARFKDPDKVNAILAPIAKHLTKYPDKELACVGTIAGEQQSEKGKELSLKRATAVRDNLVSYGVASDRIHPIGSGIENPWHINVPTDSPESQHNRSVVLLSVKDAKRLNLM